MSDDVKQGNRATKYFLFTVLMSFACRSLVGYIAIYAIYAIAMRQLVKHNQMLFSDRLEVFVICYDFVCLFVAYTADYNIILYQCNMWLK